MGSFIPIVIGVLVAAGILAFLASIYKVAEIDKVLVVTGGKEPVIKVAGGAFVFPIFRKASFFDTCIMTVRADEDEIKTRTAVPIVCNWTAQIRPIVTDTEVLKEAIRSFKERGPDGIIEDVKRTLMGAVSDVVSGMTPEEILRDKDKFKEAIQRAVADELEKMGLEMISLNIQDIADRNGYFDNIAAIDASEKLMAAEIKKAEVEKETRQKSAEAQKEAAIAETTATQQTEIAKMDAELRQKEKRKDADLKLAQYMIETDTANANAAVAKELQASIRAKELEERKGAVEITRQEQENLAAQKQREVMITRAEAEKATKQVAAEADANVMAIEAAARVKVAEHDAEAVVKAAEAEASKTRAEGEAFAAVEKAKILAQVEGEKARLMAEAEGEKAKLLAQAEGEKAKLLAQAEGERALAEARASNDKVNFEIEKLKIQTEAEIRVATAQAEIMAKIGENAEFINIGGGTIPGINGAGATGNVLIDTLSQIPLLMKSLNLQNEVLNGRPVTEEVRDISKALGAGLEGLGKGSATTVPELPDTPEKPVDTIES